MMRFSLFVGVFVALTSECIISELAASELAVLVTSELGFSETVSVEATSELATGASDTVAASLEAVVAVFSAGLAVASLLAGASTSIAPSLIMASTVASLTGVGCSSAEAWLRPAKLNPKASPVTAIVTQCFLTL